MTMPLVLVRWLDSSEVSGWTILKDWDHPEPLECLSVGFLYAKGNGNLTLVPHLAYGHDENRRQGTGMMVIPEKAIVSVETLREAA